jgi:PAS domain S-box-containing protein
MGSSTVKSTGLIKRQFRKTVGSEMGFFVVFPLLAAAIFAFDLSMPLGIAAGVPYVALVLLGVWSPWNHHILTLGLVASILTIGGFLFSSENSALWIALTNRGLALFAIWSITLVAILVRRERIALEKKSTLLTTTFDTITQAFSVFDSTDTLVSFNKAYEKIFDFTPGFLRPGIPHEDIIRWRANAGHFGDGNVEQLINDCMNDIHHGREFSRERTLPNGLIYSLQRRVMPDGGYVNTLTDITRYRHVQQIAAEKSAFLETTIQTMAHGFVAYDVDLRLIAFNTQYEKIFGFASGYLKPGMGLREINKERRIQTTGVQSKNLDQWLKHPTDYVQERTFSNGRVYVCHRNPLPDGGGITSYTDITERKQAEKEVADSAALFRAAIGNMAQGFCVFNADGRLLNYNEKYLEMFDIPQNIMQAGTPFIGTHHGFKVWPGFVAAQARFHCQFNIAHADSQKIVKIMGDAAGQLAYGFHFLGLLQFLFCFFSIRDVCHRGKIAAIGHRRAFIEEPSALRIYPLDAGRFSCLYAFNLIVDECPDIIMIKPSAFGAEAEQFHPA